MKYSLALSMMLSGCAWISDDHERWRLDPDGDGVLIPDDCDDDDKDIGAPTEWNLDADGDGFGDPLVTISGCTQPEGTVLNGDDCDDSEASAHPGATEQWYDGIDQDCEGGDDYDADLDGYSANVDDCDDSDPDIHPGATDTWYDGVDADCDGNDCDADGDGYPADPDRRGFCKAEDCDDSDATVLPDPTIDEIYYNGTDDNCDHTDGDGDMDGDGHWAADYLDRVKDPDETVSVGTLDDCWDDTTTTAMEAINGFVQPTAAEVNPDATETWYDGVDSDCDGESDFDADLDGYDTDKFYNSEGLAGDDCIDGAPADANPGGVAPDLCNPGTFEDEPYDDTDCDCGGDSDWDADGDGYDSQGALGGTDCIDGGAYDDSNPAGLDPWDVNPGATETWYDNTDQDCDGLSDWDADGDGYDSDAWGGEDCDDSDATVSPGASDTTVDGVDNDCDGFIDDHHYFLADADARLLGTTKNENAGGRVAGLGDVDGDGYDDIGVSCSSGASTCLVLGPVSGDLDLSSADARLAYGSRARPGGDLDGDGMGELLLSDYSTVSLFYGQAAGLSGATADATFTGATKSGAGFWGTGVGDVDGDGTDDVAINDNWINSGSGAIYLFSGPVTGSLGVSEADRVISGGYSRELAMTPGQAGDFDGDGVTDLFVLAHGYDSNSGRAYVFSGPITSDSSTASADASIDGTGGTTGIAGDGAGDFDGDGYTDVLLTTRYFTDQPILYVLQGPISGSMSVSDAVASYGNGSTDSLSSESVSTAGDFDGDGKDDFVLGVHGISNSYALLVLGPTTGHQDLDEADAIFHGEASTDNDGSNVDGAGDVDGDGLDDLLISASDNDTNATDAGAAYLVLGRDF